MRRTCLAALLTTIAALAVAPSASAGIWTPVGSATTQDITAVDYRGPGDILYATGGGRIYRNGTLQLSDPAASFTDIALNAAGDRGLATAANGKLYRYNGATWSLLGLASTTFGHECSSVGPFLRNVTPTGNLVAVTWASDTVAYVASADRGVVLKVGPGGTTVSDVSRQTTGACRADAGFLSAFSDVQAVTDQLITLATTDFGARRVTTDAFASTAIARNDSGANCPGVPSRLAIDLDNASRSWIAGGCPGSLSFGFSSDAASTYDFPSYPNAQNSELAALNDVAAGGGSAVAVGDAGTILVNLDGRSAYMQRADGGDSGTDWLSVDKRSAVDAAVGGRGGKLLVSTQANVIPDLVPPAGTISGPTRVTVGQPATYTANVADDAGGSGIDPAAFAWSATGVPAATGNPATLTFPSPGSYNLRVAFRDNAGNPGQAILSVEVGAARPAAVVPPGTVPKALSATVTKSVTVAGGTVTLGVPRRCVPARSTFTATLSFKRSTRKGANFVKVTRVDFLIDGKRRKIDRRAPFRQRLTVRNLRAGTKHTLRARATIKVKRGRSPKKSITTSFTVCR